MGKIFLSIPDAKEELLAWASIALRARQCAELALEAALELPMHPSATITLEGLRSEEESNRRRTVGQLIWNLRKRASIAPELEDLLNTFLEHRNKFVHGLTTRDEFDLLSPVGRQKLEAFLKGFIADVHRVAVLFGSLVAGWAKDLEFAAGGAFKSPFEPPLRVQA